jgi:hypothetical protein
MATDRLSYGTATSEPSGERLHWLSLQQKLQTSRGYCNYREIEFQSRDVTCSGSGT